MLVISRISLLPFAAAFLAAFLVASTVRALKRGERIVVYFLLLNISTMLWSFFYGVELNLDTSVALDVSPIGSAAYMVYVLEILGLAAAPTYWFLFAAAYGRKRRWVEGWRMWLAHAPFAFTLVVAASNPVHQLFVSQAGPGAPVGYGPLAYPSLIATYVLVGWGTWLVIATTWKPGTQTDRVQAIVLGLAALMPFLGGMAWGLRHVLGLPLHVHPVPVLFPVLNAVLLYQVLNKGLADIVPVAALQAFHTMADAVLIVNEVGVVVAMNPAAERLLTDGEPGMRLRDVDPELGEQAVPFLEGQADFSEFELQRGDAVYWGRVRRTLGRHDRGVGLIVMLTDVTELREAQLELAALNKELASRVIELDDARESAEARGRELMHTIRDLEEATRAKDRFLANMSHELRTPLNSVLGFSGILLQGAAGELTQEQRKQLELINHAGKRLLELINEILDLSKIQAGKLEMRFEPVDIRGIVDSVVAHIEPRCRDKGLDLTVRALVGNITLITDAGRLEQILLNLLTNAVKYTDRGGIVFEAIPNGDRMEFRVSDTGVGIPADAIDRVFLEFEQIEDAFGERRSGAGLGLSISRKLAALLGGDITVRSAVGEGSTFTVSLPLE